MGGGAERVLINLLKKFDYKEYTVDLLVGINKGIYFDEVPSNVKTKFLFQSQFFERLLGFLFRTLGLRFLVKILVNNKITSTYDAGISFIDSHYTDYLLCLGTKLKKKIAWVHASYGSYDNYSRFYKGRYKERLIKLRYKKLDRIVFVSNDSRGEFMQIFGQSYNTDVIYNIIDVEGVKSKANEIEGVNIGINKIHIISLGSLLPVKAFDRLILAADMLKDDGLNFIISILGTGYLLKELTLLITSLGVESYVEFLGYKSNPYPFLKSSDIFIMTSKSEALPTALCEAMVLGKPCIVTNCSGCRELVGNGEYGLMVDQNVYSIYQGLRELIVNHDKREYFAARSTERALIFNDQIVLNKIYSIL